MPNVYTFYSGSRTLQPWCEHLGLRVDQVNFVASMLACVPIGFIYSKYLDPRNTSSLTRSLVSAAVGLMLCLFNFGLATKHILGESFLCYFFLISVPWKYVHRVVFIFSMAYLCGIHYFKYRYVDYYLLDVTGPMMILTQKVIWIAFELHDRANEADTMNKAKRASDNKDGTIPGAEAPSLELSFPEFLSFTLGFQSVLGGPSCGYGQHISFLRGGRYWLVQMPGETSKVEPRVTEANEEIEEVPGSTKVVLTKIAAAIFFLSIGYYATKYSINEALNPSWSFFGKLFHISWFMVLARSQYYFLWMLVDAIANASGFGFNGYDENGSPRWDLVSNIDILTVEFPSNMRDFAAAWNMQSRRWLRYCCYIRLNGIAATLATFLLSAVWHGFYPGYYIAFASWALFTIVGRVVRRNIRPLIMDYDSRAMKRCYDVVTTVSTHLAIDYGAASFVLLHASASLELYKQTYFIFHVLAIALLVLTPLIPRFSGIHRQQTRTVRNAAGHIKKEG